MIFLIEVIYEETTGIASIIGSVVAVTLVVAVVVIGILIWKRNRRYFYFIWSSNVNCVYYHNDDDLQVYEWKKKKFTYFGFLEGYVRKNKYLDIFLLFEK